MQDEALPSVWLVTLQLLGAGITLLLWLVVSKAPLCENWCNKKDAIRIVMTGIFGFIGMQYAYHTSIQTGNGVTTSLMHFASPAIVLVWFSVRQRHWPIKWDVIALVTASVGMVLLLTNGSFAQLTVPAISILWGAISAIAGAFYVIQPVQLIKKYGAMVVVGWGMTIGGIIMSFFNPPWMIPEMTPRAWSLLLCITFAGTLLGFVLYLGSLKYIRPIESGLLGCVEPLVAFLSAYLFLNHTWRLFEALGGMLIIAAVCMILFNQEQKQLD
jgi:drug/metabolite transporter (DMT)-like permease